MLHRFVYTSRIESRSTGYLSTQVRVVLRDLDRVQLYYSTYYRYPGSEHEHDGNYYCTRYLSSTVWVLFSLHDTRSATVEVEGQ